MRACVRVCIVPCVSVCVCVCVCVCVVVKCCLEVVDYKKYRIPHPTPSPGSVFLPPSRCVLADCVCICRGFYIIRCMSLRSDPKLEPESGFWNRLTLHPGNDNNNNNNNIHKVVSENGGYDPLSRSLSTNRVSPRGALTSRERSRVAVTVSNPGD